MILLKKMFSTKFLSDFENINSFTDLVFFSRGDAKYFKKGGGAYITCATLATAVFIALAYMLYII